MATDNNSNAILQSILPLTSQVNAVTGLHDDQIAALKGILAKQDKTHAQDFVNQVGQDKARQLVDAHQATTPDEAPSSNANSVLDPLIAMARKGQTQVPSETVTNPSGPANVKTGTVELDKPANWFEQNFGNAQTPYQDANGVIHAKLGGRFNQENDIPTLQKMGLLQTITGKENPNPINSISYQVEQAIQQAQKVPMTQEQKANYALNVQGKGLELANMQVGQFNEQAKPTLTALQKIDQLNTLGQQAISGDKAAQAAYVAGTKDLIGTSGNILGQGAIQKAQTWFTGGYNPGDVKKSLAAIQQIRQQQIQKLAGLEKSATSRIGNLKIGNQIVNASALVNHPYTKETSYVNNTFKTETEAKRANLPEGTPMTLNGVQGIWSNK